MGHCDREREEYVLRKKEGDNVREKKREKYDGRRRQCKRKKRGV